MDTTATTVASSLLSPSSSSPTTTSSSTTTTTTPSSSSAPAVCFSTSADAASSSFACRELLLELKRSSGGGGGAAAGASNRIPSYNDALVRRSLHELQLYSQQLEHHVTAATTPSNTATATPKKPDMAVRPALFLLDAMIQRHKQCLLAYHRVRWDRLRSQLQNDDVNSTTSHQQLQQVLSEAEQDLWKDYDALVTNHIHQHWKFRPCSGGDSSSSSANNMCQVRVIHSNKMVVVLSSSGQVFELIPGAILYLPREDVHDLVNQGILEPVAGEEDLE